MTEYSDVLRICGGAILALVCIQVLRTYDKSSLGNTAAVCFSVLLASAAVGAAVPLLRYLRNIAAPYLASGYADILWKAMAVGMTVQLTSDTIREAGEGALADRVDFVGRTAILCIGLPLYGEIFELAGGLLRIS